MGWCMVLVGPSSGCTVIAAPAAALVSAAGPSVGMISEEMPPAIMRKHTGEGKSSIFEGGSIPVAILVGLCANEALSGKH